MALILSIETSTSVCSVALHLEGQLLAYQAMPINRSHAESLLSMIHHLLENYSIGDLTSIAVSEGPGSYTGLRIGVATATGLCYALDIPLIAINTLEAMLVPVQLLNIQRALRCPMLDARRMEVYCLLADADGQIIAEAHPYIVKEGSFAELLAEQEVWFFGDGAAKCKPLLAHQKNAIFLEGISPSAKEIGVLAYHHFREQKFVDINSFTPKYLKPFMGTHKS